MATSPPSASLRDRRLLGALLAPVDPVAAIGWADALIAEFGSLAETLSARPARLAKALDGAAAPARALAAHRAAMLQALRERAFDRPILRASSQLLEYLRLSMARDAQEGFRVLFLDAGYRVIADEVLAQGGVSSCHIEPRTVIARALELGAVGLILVHNHPSGDPAPSEADHRITHRIADAGQHLGIAVRDHIVIARHGHEMIETTTAPR